MKNYLVTWFYSEQANDESYYPSVGGSSSSAEIQYVYWRCVYDFYRSALITNGDVITDYVFFTNVEKLPTVDGVNFKEFFDENQIKVVYQELTRKTPKDWYGAWRNQFYLFDILEYFKEEEGNLLMLDSDCVITHSMKELYGQIEKEGTLTLPIDYSLERDINGCSIVKMRELYEQFFAEDQKAPDKGQLLYMGGEFVAMRMSDIHPLLEVFELIWKKNRECYEKKEQKLNEEAHVLSLCYYRLGMQNEKGRSYIRRIWNALDLDQVRESDRDLPIWHLPAEKKFGFYELFVKLKKKKNLGSQQLYRLCDRVMKLSASKTRRKCNWYYRYGKQKIKRILGR
ncbi:MAG: hypothetical protein ACI4F0_10000 [Agathobacter sp.]